MPGGGVGGGIRDASGCVSRIPRRSYVSSSHSSARRPFLGLVDGGRRRGDTARCGVNQRPHGHAVEAEEEEPQWSEGLDQPEPGQGPAPGASGQSAASCIGPRRGDPWSAGCDQPKQHQREQPECPRNRDPRPREPVGPWNPAGHSHASDFRRGAGLRVRRAAQGSRRCLGVPSSRHAGSGTPRSSRRQWGSDPRRSGAARRPRTPGRGSSDPGAAGACRQTGPRHPLPGVGPSG